MSARLFDDRASRFFDTARKLLGHPHFSQKLAAAIRRRGGVDRAIAALIKEFEVFEQIDFESETCDFLSGYWKVSEDQFPGRVTGKWVCRPEEILLIPAQDLAKSKSPSEVLNRFKHMTVLPVHVMDYLIDGVPELTPIAWKGKKVFFWGTLFGSSDDTWVRYMEWSEEDHKWTKQWLRLSESGVAYMISCGGKPPVLLGENAYAAILSPKQNV